MIDGVDGGPALRDHLVLVGEVGDCLDDALFDIGHSGTNSFVKPVPNISRALTVALHLLDDLGEFRLRVEIFFRLFHIPLFLRE